VKLATYCQDCSLAPDSCKLWLPFDLQQIVAGLPHVYGEGEFHAQPGPACILYTAHRRSIHRRHPVRQRQHPGAVLVLADQVRSKEELAQLAAPMGRLVKMVTNRLDNLSLLDELKTLAKNWTTVWRSGPARHRSGNCNTAHCSKASRMQYSDRCQTSPGTHSVREHHCRGNVRVPDRRTGWLSVAIIGQAYEPEPLAARMIVVDDGMTYRGSFESRRRDGTSFPVDVVERMILMGSDLIPV